MTHGRGHHHHDRPVLADDVDIGPGPEKVAGGSEKFGADAHRQQTAGEQEGENGHQVLHAHNLVVQGEAEKASSSVWGRRGAVPGPTILAIGYLKAPTLREPTPGHHEREGKAYGGDVLTGALDAGAGCLQ